MGKIEKTRGRGKRDTEATGNRFICPTSRRWMAVVLGPVSTSWAIGGRRGGSRGRCWLALALFAVDEDAVQGKRSSVRCELVTNPHTAPRDHRGRQRSRERSGRDGQTRPCTQGRQCSRGSPPPPCEKPNLFLQRVGFLLALYNGATQRRLLRLELFQRLVVNHAPMLCVSPPHSPFRDNGDRPRVTSAVITHVRQQHQLLLQVVDVAGGGNTQNTLSSLARDRTQMPTIQQQIKRGKSSRQQTVTAIITAITATATELAVPGTSTTGLMSA